MAMKVVCVSWLACLCLMGVVDPIEASDVSPNSPPTPSVVSNEVRALLGPADTVLAYKQVDTLGAGGAGAVAVVRHPVASNDKKNPCDLIVFQRKSGALAVKDRGAKVVDCIYNDIQKDAKELALDDNLAVKSQEITYINQEAKSNTRYVFAYSKSKAVWHLQQAVAVYPRNNEVTGRIDTMKGVLVYPRSLGWITLSSFDPELLQGDLEKHTELVK